MCIFHKSILSVKLTGILGMMIMDSAQGLPNAGFAKAFVMFSGFIILVSAQVIFFPLERGVD